MRSLKDGKSQWEAEKRSSIGGRSRRHREAESDEDQSQRRRSVVKLDAGEQMQGDRQTGRQRGRAQPSGMTTYRQTGRPIFISKDPLTGCRRPRRTRGEAEDIDDEDDDDE